MLKQKNVFQVKKLHFFLLDFFFILEYNDYMLEKKIPGSFDCYPAQLLCTGNEKITLFDGDRTEFKLTNLIKIVNLIKVENSTKI